jgi:hypothetical protein
MGHTIRHHPTWGRFYASAELVFGAIYKLAHTHDQGPANVALSKWTWSNRSNTGSRDLWSA